MAVQFKDYYEILGVPRTASQDDIKRAFRKLARKYHPDVAKNKVEAEERFKEANEAHEVLSNPENRKKYDDLGQHWREGGFPPSPPPGHGRRGRAQQHPDFEFDGTGFSDFFEQFFGGRTGFQGFSGQSEPEENKDFEGDILVTLPEALKGTVRTVVLRRPGASGKAESTDTYQVKIPPGVREGQRVRLAGQGAGRGSRAGAGDLYLRVRFASHPDFQVEGSDLNYELSLAPWEAVLGAQVKIPALEGSATLKVPAGTQPGGRMRLRGLGLPSGPNQRGDLYVLIQIAVPEEVSPVERKLWEDLAKGSAFNPRK